MALTDEKRKAIQTIRKLFALAKGNAAEGEKQAALDRAYALMRKHELSPMALLGSLGGKRRAENLTPEELSDIGRSGGEARGRKTSRERRTASAVKAGKASGAARKQGHDSGTNQP